MSKLEMLRDFINRRLTTAALDIFAAAEKYFAEFEEEISRSKEESARLQRLLDIINQHEIKIHRPDVQQFSFLEPPQIKVEQQLWTSQEELQGLQSETSDSMFTSNSVKQDWDQEGFSECSHIDQTVKVENREEDTLPSNTTEEQIRAGSDGQDYAAPESGSDLPLSVVAPDCPTAQSLKKEDHGGLLLFHSRTRNFEALPREYMRQTGITGKTRHQCQHCKKTYSQKSNLNIHMRTHTGEKPYQCQECSKRFAYGSSLDQHKRTHTGEKPYKCQECSKRFSQSASLESHMRIHTGEKPYKCQECSKLFAHSGSLGKHIRTHTGEKPFQCQECRKRFSQKSHLVGHMRTHRRETLSMSGM